MTRTHKEYILLGVCHNGPSSRGSLVGRTATTRLEGHTAHKAHKPWKKWDGTQGWDDAKPGAAFRNVLGCGLARDWNLFYLKKITFAVNLWYAIFLTLLFIAASASSTPSPTPSGLQELGSDTGCWCGMMWIGLLISKYVCEGIAETFNFAYIKALPAAGRGKYCHGIDFLERGVMAQHINEFTRF